MRQHEKKKAAIEQEFANELREAKATIAQDAALNPAIRSARARMPQYAARIKSAAEIVNRAAKR